MSENVVVQSPVVTNDGQNHANEVISTPPSQSTLEMVDIDISEPGTSHPTNTTTSTSTSSSADPAPTTDTTVPNETDETAEFGKGVIDSMVYYDESEDYEKHNSWAKVRGQGFGSKCKWAMYKCIDGADYLGSFLAGILGLDEDGNDIQYVMHAAERMERERNELEQQEREEERQRQEAMEYQLRQEQSRLESGLVLVEEPAAAE